MATNSSFHDELQKAVGREAGHPLITKVARGKASRKAINGMALEHWHWLSRIVPETFFNICKRAPDDVIAMELENFEEETDPENPHVDLILRFAKACGIDKKKIKVSEPLPTTDALVNWQTRVAKEQDWAAGVATIHVASESQVPKLFSKVLPALRKTYKFSERDLEFWWLHVTADQEHGGRAFQLLERHCKTRAEKDRVIYWARQAARMKWLFWDGIHLHYEMGYKLQ